MNNIFFKTIINQFNTIFKFDSDFAGSSHISRLSKGILLDSVLKSQLILFHSKGYIQWWNMLTAKMVPRNVIDIFSAKNFISEVNIRNNTGANYWEI